MAADGSGNSCVALLDFLPAALLLGAGLLALSDKKVALGGSSEAMTTGKA